MVDMPNRTQLTEALDVWRYDETGVVREAARLLLDFPTDEQVEAAARAWCEADRPGAKPMSIPWEHMNPGLKRQYRVRVRAALEAVRQVMFGD